MKLRDLMLVGVCLFFVSIYAISLPADDEFCNKSVDEIVCFLKKNSVENLKCYFYDTTLHWMASQGNFRSLNIFLESGWDILEQDVYGRTVFHCVVIHKAHNEGLAKKMLLALLTKGFNFLPGESGINDESMIIKLLPLFYESQFLFLKDVMRVQDFSHKTIRDWAKQKSLFEIVNLIDTFLNASKLSELPLEIESSIKKDINRKIFSHDSLSRL